MGWCPGRDPYWMGQSRCPGVIPVRRNVARGREERNGWASSRRLSHDAVLERSSA